MIDDTLRAMVRLMLTPKCDLEYARLKNLGLQETMWALVEHGFVSKEWDAEKREWKFQATDEHFNEFKDDCECDRCQHLRDDLEQLRRTWNHDIEFVNDLARQEEPPVFPPHGPGKKRPKPKKKGKRR